MWMSLSDELGAENEGAGGRHRVSEVNVKTKWKYWLKRVAFLWSVEAEEQLRCMI